MGRLTSDVPARKRSLTPIALGALPVLAGLALLVGGVAIGVQPGSTTQDDIWFVPIYVPSLVTGAVILARHPRNPVGWLLAWGAAAAYVGSFIEQYAHRAFVVAPGSLPFADAFAWMTTWVWNFTLFSLLFVVFLFPTGRPASPRWRPALWASAAVIAFVTLVFAFGPDVDPTSLWPNPFAIEALRPLAIWVNDSFWLFIVMLFLAVASVVARFRSARGAERQQMKWAAGGCVVAGIAIAASNFVQVSPISDVAWIISTAAIPISFAIAMLRYGLYEIDVLINRALVYGALSALLLGTYVLLVLALTALLRPVTGSGDIAVAGSTLAVLALFQPVRARIQRFVDRRFYRARYDAARTIDRFGTRLREQVDLDQLRTELIGVVDETIKPSHASLWLRR